MTGEENTQAGGVGGGCSRKRQRWSYAAKECLEKSKDRFSGGSTALATP